MALGIDVYRAYQNVTDWQAVKAHGVGWCYVKLTDGGGVPPVGPGDALVAGAKSAGIPVGGYHFVKASPGPERQAEIFIAEVERLGATGLAPMLDLEDHPDPDVPRIPMAEKKAFATRFCQRVRELGFRPGVYLNDDLARHLRPDRWGVPGLVIWIARYGARPHADAGRYDLHQYTDGGHVPGIAAKSVDLTESFSDNHFLTEPIEEDDDMAGPQDHEYAPSEDKQYHHRTIETRSISAVVGDVWFALSAGYHPMTDMVVFFNGKQAPIEIPSIDPDTRMVWQVPDGCESISWEYYCKGPSSSAVIYGKR